MYAEVKGDYLLVSTYWAVPVTSRAFTFSTMSWVAVVMLADMSLMSLVILSTSALTSRFASDMA